MAKQAVSGSVWWVADCRHCDREIIFRAPGPQSRSQTDNRSTRCAQCGQPERAVETLKHRRHRQ